MHLSANVFYSMVAALSTLLAACSAQQPKQQRPAMKASLANTATSVAAEASRPTDSTGLATGQTYTEAMRIVCKMARILLSSPQSNSPYRVQLAYAQLERKVQNLQARAFFRLMATTIDKAGALRHALARAGICNCKGLPPVRSCAALRATPPPLAPQKTARTLRAALKAYCDPALQLKLGPAFENDGPEYKHAAYVDARVDNAALRRILNFRSGHSDSRRHRTRLFQQALRQAGLNECATVKLTLPAKLSPSPAPAPPPKRLLSITGADGIMCATRAGGLPACIGNLRVHERLGANLRKRVETNFPVGIPGLADAIEISAGSVSNVCALRRNGELLCWNTRHPKNRDQYLRKPTVVQRNVRSADSTDGHLCAVSRRGVVRCWGSNWCGETGSRKRGRYHAATVKLPKAVRVTVGQHFSCAVTVKAKVYCWGAHPGKTFDAQNSCKARPRPRLVPRIV
jgi:hypothetical protein